MEPFIKYEMQFFLCAIIHEALRWVILQQDPGVDQEAGHIVSPAA